MFTELLEYIYKNKLFVDKLYHSLYSQFTTRFLEQIVVNYIRSVLVKINGTSKEENHKYDSIIDNIADFYTYAIVGRLSEWIDKGMKEPVDKLAYNLATIMEGTLENTMQCFMTLEK